MVSRYFNAALYTYYLPSAWIPMKEFSQKDIGKVNNGSSDSLLRSVKEPGWNKLKQPIYIFSFTGLKSSGDGSKAD